MSMKHFIRATHRFEEITGVNWGAFEVNCRPKWDLNARLIQKDILSCIERARTKCVPPPDRLPHRLERWLDSDEESITWAGALRGQRTGWEILRMLLNCTKRRARIWTENAGKLGCVFCEVAHEDSIERKKLKLSKGIVGKGQEIGEWYVDAVMSNCKGGNNHERGNCADAEHRRPMGVGFLLASICGGVL